MPYNLERGVVTSLGVPGNSLTWVDANDAAVLGADLVSTPAFYEMKAAVAHETRERLVALTFALFFHEDARRHAAQ